jgi:hypothetical protein
MTKRCLYVRCMTCGGLMYIDEAEVVTCGCPAYDPDRPPFVFEGPWKPADEEQAINRMQRGSGTGEEVKVVRLTTNGDVDKSIEEARKAKE